MDGDDGCTPCPEVDRRAGEPEAEAEAEAEVSNDCHAGDIGMTGDGWSKAALNAFTLGDGNKSPRLSDLSSLSSRLALVSSSDVILPAVGNVRPRIFNPAPPPPAPIAPPEGDRPERRGLVGVSSISTLILGINPPSFPPGVTLPSCDTLILSIFSPFGSIGDIIWLSLKSDGERIVGRRDEEAEGNDGVGNVVSVVSDAGDG